jgi:UBX domain-containing protein 1
MPIATLRDMDKKEFEDDKTTDAYAGGYPRVLTVENPRRGPSEDDWSKMQANSAANASTGGGPLPADAVTVTVYRNGFTVNDGPFRPTSDPLNKKFMDDMAACRCPAELDNGAPLHVACIDKQNEDYEEPPPHKRFESFTGKGNTLGGSSASAASAGPVQADKAAVPVDDAKTKTKILLRFHDGTKKVQEFNQDHYVGHLRGFCIQCVGANVSILAGFPPKEVTDDSATLKDAGLCGAAVTVKPRNSCTEVSKFCSWDQLDEFLLGL